MSSYKSSHCTNRTEELKLYIVLQKLAESAGISFVLPCIVWAAWIVREEWQRPCLDE